MLLSVVGYVIGQMQCKDVNIMVIVEVSFEVMDVCCWVVGNFYFMEVLINFKFVVSWVYYLSVDCYWQDLDCMGLFFINLINVILVWDVGEFEVLVVDFGVHQKVLIYQVLVSSV